jgi:ssDNA-binding Zn-finger/Zn-ribbon topoisomerase 1
MGNFRYALARFMAGRYGIDQLYLGLMALYFIVIFINVFVRSNILLYGDNLILFFMVFRMLSRNIPKRQRENQAFLRMMGPFKDSLGYRTRQLRELRTHAYHKCPNCRSVLRFPRKAGRFPVTCPKCGNKFNIRNWF